LASSRLLVGCPHFLVAPPASPLRACSPDVAPRRPLPYARPVVAARRRGVPPQRSTVGSATDPVVRYPATGPERKAAQRGRNQSVPGIRPRGTRSSRHGGRPRARRARLADGRGRGEDAGRLV